MLYQPTAYEVTSLMQRAARAWPHMAAAINKAEQLLLTQAITATMDHFIVNSQSNPAYNYRVRTDQGYRRCGCPSYTTSSYVASDRHFCKHLIAVEAYVEILRDQLRPRLYGNSNERATRQMLAAYPDTYLMRIGHTRTLTNIDQARIFLAVRWGERKKLTFVSNHDAIVFAHWLHKAKPAPLLIDRYDEELAKQQAAAEWQVNLTPEQLKRWYDTGSIV